MRQSLLLSLIQNLAATEPSLDNSVGTSKIFRMDIVYTICDTIVIQPQFSLTLFWCGETTHKINHVSLLLHRKIVF